MEKRFKYDRGELYFSQYNNKWVHSGTDGGGHGAWGREFKNVEELFEDIDKSIISLEENTKKQIEYLKKLKGEIKNISPKKYVKLVSKPGTFFKEGKEVYKVYFEPSPLERITLEDFEEYKNKYNYVFCWGYTGKGADIHHSDVIDFNVEIVTEKI